MSATAKKLLITSSDRFSLTFCLAIIVHGIVLLGVTFTPEESRQRFETMEIILVEQQSETSHDAKALSQANLKGGGNLTEDSEAAAPQRAPFPDEKIKEVSSSAPPPPPPATGDPDAVTDTEPQAGEAAKQIAVESDQATESLNEKTNKKPEDIKPTGITDQETDGHDSDQQSPKKPLLPPTQSAMSLMARNQEIASLATRIEERLKKRASRTRKKFISASTKESKYAFYMKSWSEKVERIGNLNYPDDAIKNKLFGSLRLDVALNQDGSVNKITIIKSSGHQILDAAAVRIVKLAEPYVPFPDDIRKETDVLHIIRTWKFLDNQRFR